MDLGLAGKTALVTASSGGMGANIARALAAEGADLVLFARSEGRVHSVATSIEQDYGVKARAVVGSMIDDSDVERLVKEIAFHCRGLDVVVLNTGRPPSPLRATVEEMEQQRWDESYETLLAGVIKVTQKVHPLMTQKGWGRIIAITSASVHQPMPHHALSTVFRAGVEAFMKHLSSELGPHGVTVNCVAPALIETPHRTGVAAYSAEQIEKRKQMNAMRRLGTQEELCSAICFLASVGAGFVTGTSLRIDGGLVPRQ